MKTIKTYTRNVTTVKKKKIKITKPKYRAGQEILIDLQGAFKEINVVISTQTIRGGIWSTTKNEWEYDLNDNRTTEVIVSETYIDENIII